MVNVPPPLWALFYLLIVTGLSYLLEWPTIPGLPLVTPAIALIAIGIALTGSAIILFRRQGTEIYPASPTNRLLVTSGPYEFTRNPMYLGLVIVSLGIAFWVGAWSMFLAPIATFVTVNWRHIPFEEEKMRRQFGKDFDAYTAKVRRWI
jgi:protein-S-isoprenylcysteine O-methyltransferase Ste14